MNTKLIFIFFIFFNLFCAEKNEETTNKNLFALDFRLIEKICSKVYLTSYNTDLTCKINDKLFFFPTSLFDKEELRIRYWITGMFPFFVDISWKPAPNKKYVFLPRDLFNQDTTYIEQDLTPEDFQVL